ncbi:MAG: imidazoleglycerol-phosphate dehydratase HisB [Clostridiales bacterium]|nr:imidazoleglycerol-phosphate dehydratase HisB [Clostridiales bacterium]
MRTAEIKRKTGETDISLSLNLDGSGKGEINTGCGFLDHMLSLFKKHGSFDLTVNAKGDTYVDYHHTVEDIGISLGQAFKSALGDKAGIVRYGDTTLPMDEALILTAVDISGRGFFVQDINITSNKVGDFDTELVNEILIAFSYNAGITLHVRQIAGSNAHHIIEGIFKSLARTLKKAVAIDPTLGGEIPSTKGVL